MGNAGSAHAQASLQVIARLSGGEALPLSSAEWQPLLSYAPPLSRYDPDEVEREIRPHCAELVYNNAHTHNLQRLIYLVVRQLRTARRRNQASTATANAVYCLRTILKDLMEQLNAAQLATFIEVSPEKAAAAAAAAAASQAAMPTAAAGEGGSPAAVQPAAAEAGGGSGGSGEAAGVEGEGEGGAAAADELRDLHNGSLVETLVREAMLTLADGTLLAVPGGYGLLLEAAQLLLALGSSVLYSPSPRGQLGQHPYLDAAMRQRDLANPMAEALLGYFVAAPPVPLRTKVFQYVPYDARSALRIVRSAAASVLWLPYQAYTLLLRPVRSASADGEAGAAGAAGAASDVASASPLGDTSLLLLLALVFHAPPQDAPFGNPYRQALGRLQDADDLGTDDAAEGGRTAALGGDAATSYARLYEALGAALTSERTVLLLYALLHGCPRFQEYCLVRSDLDTLLLPLLELLYSAPQRTPNQMYMLLIILLMMSQDAAFAQNIHRIALPSVPFYRERSTSTTLGSLLVVLLLRTAHYNLAKLRDVYLHTNTLAALANLAPHMAGLSTHAAQRLVSLLHLLARRYSRLQAAAEGSAASPPLLPPTPTFAAQASAALESPLTPWTPAGAPTPVGAPAPGAGPVPAPGAQQAAAAAVDPQAAAAAAAASGGGPGAGLPGAAGAGQQQQQQQQQPTAEQRELELQLYADFLRIVLEIINSILTSALPQNPELVYTLLHRQEVFAPFAAHPRYAELMENIGRVTEFFNRRVEEAAAGGGALSVERLLDLIRQHSRGWRRDRLRPFPELRFTYEEEASPEEFFVPYVWSLAVAQGGIPFSLPAIQLFTPTVVPDAAADELSPRNLDTARIVSEGADGTGVHLPGTRSAAVMGAGGDDAVPSPV